MAEIVYTPLWYIKTDDGVVIDGTGEESGRKTVLLFKDELAAQAAIGNNQSWKIAMLGTTADLVEFLDRVQKEGYLDYDFSFTKTSSRGGSGAPHSLDDLRKQIAPDPENA